MPRIDIPALIEQSAHQLADSGDVFPQLTRNAVQIGQFAQARRHMIVPAPTDEISPAMRQMSQLFTDHPRAVNETYLQHARVASGFALQLAVAALAALVHALLPFLCERSASDAVEKLHQQLQSRH